MGGSSATIRDVVICDSVEGLQILGPASPSVENVVVRDGKCGVSAWRSAPTLRGCVFEGNTVDGSACGAIHLAFSQATIEGCTIQGNGSTGGGDGTGGIAVLASSATIRDCLITGNRSFVGGVSVIAPYSGTLSFARIEGCTITANEGTGRGGSGAGGLYVGEGSTAIVDHAILWGNCATSSLTSAPEIYLADATAVLEINCSDVRLDGVSGPGVLRLGNDVIDADPLFCQPLPCDIAPVVGGVYTLASTSPALTLPCGPAGALGTGCTISIEALSWGAIKSRYR
jgi:hypothetical protein